MESGRKQRIRCHWSISLLKVVGFGLFIRLVGNGIWPRAKNPLPLECLAAESGWLFGVRSEQRQQPSNSGFPFIKKHIPASNARFKFTKKGCCFKCSSGTLQQPWLVKITDRV